jgi:hypothetical protein
MCRNLKIRQAFAHMKFNQILLIELPHTAAPRVIFMGYDRSNIAPMGNLNLTGTC